MNEQYLKLDKYLELRKNSEGIAFVKLDAGVKFPNEILIPVYVSPKAVSEIRQIEPSILEVSDKTGLGFAVDGRCIRMVTSTYESINLWNSLMDMYEESSSTILSINGLFKFPDKSLIDYNLLANQIYITFNSDSRRNMRIIRKEYIDTEFEATSYSKIIPTVASFDYPVLIPVKYYSKFYDPTKNVNPTSNVVNDGYIVSRVYPESTEDKKEIKVYDIHQNIITVDVDDLLVLKPTAKNTPTNINALYDVWFRNSANNFKLTHIFYENYKALKSK